MPSVLDSLIQQSNVAALEEKLDEQTFELLVDVYRHLRDRLSLDDNEFDAFVRVMDSMNRSSMGKDVHRNNIFKAAHALGMKLPSHSF